MQEKYTTQARNALTVAEKTAKRCRHSYIGTEHLLLGLLMEPEGTAGILLGEFGVEQERPAVIDRPTDRSPAEILLWHLLRD